MLGHNHRVSKRLANGQITVKGHCGQDEKLRTAKDEVEEALSHAANKANCGPGFDECLKHLGDNCCGVADLQESEVAQEDVHGGLKFWLNGYNE